MTSDIRIVFMGSPSIAEESLRALLNAGRNVVAVVTQPAKPSGRSKAPVDTPVKTLALSKGIPVLEPVKIRDSAFTGKLKSFSPDLIAVVAYGKILPEEILNMPRLGCVNLHASILPYYRGSAPVSWAIANGEKKTGVTTMLMDKGMDTGAMLLTEETPIGEAETAEDVLKRLSKIGAALLLKTIDLLEGSAIKAVAQDNSKATYAPILKKEDGLIDWSRPAVDVYNRMRAFTPWPGAYTFLNGKMVKVHSARVEEGEGEPGKILLADATGIKVGCRERVLVITEIQIEGKKRMSVEEFLRGHKVEGRSFDGKQ